MKIMSNLFQYFLFFKLFLKVCRFVCVTTQKSAEKGRGHYSVGNFVPRISQYWGKKVSNSFVCHEVKVYHDDTIELCGNCRTMYLFYFFGNHNANSRKLDTAHYYSSIRTVPCRILLSYTQHCHSIWIPSGYKNRFAFQNSIKPSCLYIS